jgi:uncharacterized linocin/CFP29 family protein
MTGILRPEDYQYVMKNIFTGHLDELVARRIIAPDPNVPRGAQEAKRWKYNYPDDGAQYIPKGGEYPHITTTQTAVTVPIHKIGLGVQFDEWDLESSRNLGQFALDKQLVQDVGRKIAEKEDSYIFNGDTAVNVTGLYGSAGNTFGCTTKWDAAGAEPYEDMNQAMGKLEEDGFTGKYFVMNKQDFMLLRQEDAYGNVYMDKVLQNLGINRANILKTATLTKGTGLLCDSGSNVAELKMAEELTVLPPERHEDTITINAREKLGLDVYEVNAFCTVTNIS